MNTTTSLLRLRMGNRCWQSAMNARFFSSSSRLFTPSHSASSASNPIEAKLAELNITLPVVGTPAANYLPYTYQNGVLYVSGQLPKDPATNSLTIGQLGKTVNTEEGKAAARLCGINVVAVLKHALGGDLTRVKKVTKVNCFVNSAPDYTEQHLVANGCSDLLVAVFGEAGRHARCAIGNSQLPLGVAVEVEAMVEIEGTA